MKVDSPLYYINFDINNKKLSIEKIGSIKDSGENDIQLRPQPENDVAKNQWNQLIELLVTQAEKIKSLGIKVDRFLFPAHVKGEITYTENRFVLYVESISSWRKKGDASLHLFSSKQQTTKK